jgi:hypothetical protein
MILTRNRWPISQVAKNVLSIFTIKMKKVHASVGRTNFLKFEAQSHIRSPICVFFNSDSLIIVFLFADFALFSV